MVPGDFFPTIGMGVLSQIHCPGHIPLSVFGQFLTYRVGGYHRALKPCGLQRFGGVFALRHFAETPPPLGVPAPAHSKFPLSVSAVGVSGHGSVPPWSEVGGSDVAWPATADHSNLSHQLQIPAWPIISRFS